MAKKFVDDLAVAELVAKTKQLVATKQNALPTTSTAGKVLKSTSTAGTVEWGDVSSGSSTDVKINGTSITSNNVADIKTNGTYNASTNKIATMSDLPSVSGKQDTLPATGSTTQPIYVSSAGTISTASTYAGGTKVTLNGISKSASTASFYAPTSAISTSTAKRYLVGSSSTTSVATENTNSSCYMSGGKLYSNGNEVQEKLVSGTSIKTINGSDILGSGDLTISGGTATDVKINGTSITSNNVADIKTNGTYNASTNKIATMSDLPTIDSTLSATSTNPVQNKIVSSAIDSLRKRFNTYGLVSGDPKQNPGANSPFRATALTCVIIWMDSDTSGSLNNSSGINFFTSSDGSNWTQVARFNSTSGYPKFGNICCVVPKGTYFKTNYWGMGSNNLVKMTRIVLDDYSA